MPLLEAADGLQDDHVKYAIHRYCATPKLVHLARAVRPGLLAPAALRFDTILGSAVAKMLGLPDLEALQAHPLAYAQACWPPALGGLGFRPMSLLLPAAYRGSWEDVRQTIIDRVHTPELRALLCDPAAGWDSDQHPALRELLACQRQVEECYARGNTLMDQASRNAAWQVQLLTEAGRDLLPRPPSDQARPHARAARTQYTEPPKLTPLLPGNPTTKPDRGCGLQRFLTAVLEREQFLSVLAEPTRPLLASDRTRLASCTGPHAAAFLNAFPTNAISKQPWPKGRFLTVLQLRVGLPITAIAAVSVRGPLHCLCTTPIRLDGAHCLTCPHGGHPTIRHDNVVNALCYIMQVARLNPKTEQHTHLRQTAEGRLSMGVADIVTAPAPSPSQGQSINVDVTIVQPAPSAANELGRGARLAEERKTAMYTAPIAGPAMSFVPFAVEHYGRFGQQALDLVSRISTMPATIEYLKELGYVTHDSEGRPNPMVTGMHKAWAMQRLSTALMQGVAANIHDRLQQVVAAHVPAAARHPPFLHRMHILRGA